MKNFVFIFAIFFCGNIQAQHDGYFMPSQQKIFDPEVRDTVINGWAVTYVYKAQGSIGWHWGVSKGDVIYNYDAGYQCVNAGKTTKDGLMYRIETIPCIEPPIYLRFLAQKWGIQ